MEKRNNFTSKIKAEIVLSPIRYSINVNSSSFMDPVTGWKTGKLFSKKTKKIMFYDKKYVILKDNHCAAIPEITALLVPVYTCKNLYI